VNRIHKLFKSGGVPKMETRRSAIRGYRPVHSNGYFIDATDGIYNELFIGFTGDKQDIYLEKINKILDSENIIYKKNYNGFTIDVENQNVNKEESKSIKEHSQDVKFDTDKIHELIEQGKIKPIRFSNIKIGDRLLTYNGMYCQGILKVEKKDTLRDNEGRFMVEVTGTREEPAARACGCNAFDYGDGSFLIVSDDVLQTDIIQDNNIKEDYPVSRDELINKHNGCITINDVTLEVSNLYNKKQDDYSNGYGKSYCVSNGKDSKVFINFDKAVNYMKKLNNKNEELKKVENMEMNEGMWASPFTVKNAEKVAKLLANPITLGELNSQEKQKELWNVIGDDGFWDAVANEATVEPDCDARPLIISNLEAWIDNKENFRVDAYSQEAEDIIVKAIAKFDNNSKKLTESKNVYKPSTILKALDIERNWYKEIGLSDDEKAPQVMFFIIDNDEIKDTKLVDRQDVYTYKPQANEYYLDRTRDSGFDLTDYNLSHVQKMVDSWNEGKKFEDVDSLCDKIDNATSDLQALIKSLAATKNTVVESINKCLAEALEEEIWGVEMFLDTVDGDPEPGHVEFTRDSLIDFLNDYGYELSKDASDEEIKECAEDYEMTIKYIRKPN
jgi:hypothetical protein